MYDPAFFCKGLFAFLYGNMVIPEYITVLYGKIQIMYGSIREDCFQNTLGYHSKLENHNLSNDKKLKLKLNTILISKVTLKHFRTNFGKNYLPGTFVYSTKRYDTRNIIVEPFVDTGYTRVSMSVVLDDRVFDSSIQSCRLLPHYCLNPVTP